MTWPDSTNENFKNCSTFDPSVDELVFYNKRIFGGLDEMEHDDFWRF